jgi:signal transduction histidine kinase
MPARSATPLAAAALSFVDAGATASDLRHRFAAAGVELAEPVAARLLAELRELGLVRVSRRTARAEYFVPTSLARRTRGGVSPTGDAPAALLRELEQMRTDFLATVAHELRTPLTVVSTSVGLLRDASAEPTPQQRRQLLETIDRNIGRMQRLVDDTLDLARFREGRIQLQLRRFAAADLARSVIASFPQRPGVVVLDAPRQPIYVFGDRRRLERALVNLLSNARKHSPANAPINVTVAADNDEVRWSVSDRGPGISADDQQRLFERFFVGRVDGAAASDGIGLGLPIALATVQAHGGRIEVRSELGRGSRFTMVVPAMGPDRGDEE